ncbi:unnamed protein product [Boreogadus saida]
MASFIVFRGSRRLSLRVDDMTVEKIAMLFQPAVSCQRSPRLNTGAGNKEQEQRNTHQNTEPSNSTANHRPQKQTPKYCGIAVPSSAGPHALTPALWSETDAQLM